VLVPPSPLENAIDAAAAFLSLVFVMWISLRHAEKLSAELLAREREAHFSNRLAVLGQMAGGIAHEINNPLAVLIATTQKLNRRLEDESLFKEPAPEDAGELKTGMKTIERMGERMAAIIRGMRTISRKGEEDALSHHSLLSLVQDAVVLCAEKVSAAGAVCELQQIDPAWTRGLSPFPNWASSR
jgi:C4-dicarboxylate-specific signal transduction histidine kinase